MDNREKRGIMINYRKYGAVGDMSNTTRRNTCAIREKVCVEERNGQRCDDIYICKEKA